MGFRILAVLITSMFVSSVVALVTGPLPTAGAFVATAVVGMIVVVLRRNRRDHTALEHGSVPHAVDRALCEAPPARDPF
jgi:Flp pilus assembly protein TadB